MIIGMKLNQKPPSMRASCEDKNPSFAKTGCDDTIAVVVTSGPDRTAGSTPSPAGLSGRSVGRRRQPRLLPFEADRWPLNARLSKLGISRSYSAQHHLLVPPFNTPKQLFSLEILRC